MTKKKFESWAYPLSIVAVSASISGYMFWEVFLQTSKLLEVTNITTIQVFAGAGSFVVGAFILLLWVLLSVSVHSGALIAGGNGRLSDLLHQTAYAFCFPLVSSVTVLLLWYTVLVPSLTIIGSTLQVDSPSAERVLHFAEILNVLAYIAFGGRIIFGVKNSHQLGWLQSVIVTVAPIIIVVGLSRLL